MKVALAQAGYDAYYFESADLLFSRIEEKPPHLLVFPTSGLSNGLSDFIENFLKINSEIRFITVAKASQSKTLSAYNDYGLQDLVTDEPEGLTERVTFAVDRACERLYLVYQNEQLIAAWDEEKAKGQSVQKVADVAQQAAQRLGPPLEDRIKDYRSAASKEELLRRFVQVAGKTACVFLKYLPTVRSLVVTNASVFDLDHLQGLGCQLQPNEAKDFGSQVALGIVPPSLHDLLRQAFQFHKSRLLPLFIQDRLEGVVAYSTQIALSEKMRLDDEFALMSLAYTAFTFEKRLDALEVQDPATGVGNRRFHEKQIVEEWTRARRIRQPLSVVKIALDDYYELNQTLGESLLETLLKNLAQIILKTSRTNDVISRTASNEFTMLLPHSDRNGAMLRAERLRRIVETTQMMDNGLKISISLGISEYPSLCSTAAELDQAAGKALAHIQEKGGNRLCLAKAPVNHQPEFVVNPAPPAGSS